MAPIGFGSAYAIGLYAGLVPAVVGVLGLLLLVVGTVALFRRNHLAIDIDESGLTVPRGSIFQSLPRTHVPRELIATIARHESVRGRLIEISLRSGGAIPIQARHYCDLATFLSHCREHGLPAA